MDYPVEKGDVPHVVLGGRRWAVPVLAARQNKVIDPLILSLLPVFSLWDRDKSAALGMLGQPQYDALLEIAFIAIGRDAPQLKREEFLALPVTLPELVAAFNVIAQQTGIFQKTDAKAVVTGEALAGNV